MKLQLDEHTLNLYLQKAINEEINELFGSKNNNINDNLLSTLATDINKFEQLLIIAEQGIGLNNQATQPGNKINVQGGGFDFVNTTRKNLLIAVEILSGFADRVNNVEQKLGVNTLMEASAIGGEFIDPMAALKASAKMSSTISNFGTKAPKGTNIVGKLKSLGSAVKGAQYLKFLANPYTWIVAAATIATHCVLLSRSKKKQRDIVRVANCLQILANRMKNILETLAQKAGVEIQNTPQAQQVTESIFNGMNGNKAANYIPNIAKGMTELSGLMKQIISSQQQDQVEIPQRLVTSADIKQFQKWANAHGYKDQYGESLVPDGIWGKRTSYVYDQIAAKLNQQGTQTSLMEGKFDQALANLEQKVGVTGTGGAAYADINNMPGIAGGASRLQNSENGYNIAATYPKVLNQYLSKLQELGFDTGAIEPLPIKTKASWFNGRIQYNTKDLAAIEIRINELLNIARNGISNNEKNVVLPPKPVVKKPAQTPVQPQPEDVHQKSDRRIEPISQDGIPQIPAPTVTGPSQDIVRREQQPTLAQSAVKTMGQTANQATMGLNDKIATNRRTAQNAKNAINKAVRNGSMPKDQAKADKRLVKGVERALRTGKPLKEDAFKKLVKQIIAETLNK